MTPEGVTAPTTKAAPVDAKDVAAASNGRHAGQAFDVAAFLAKHGLEHGPAKDYRGGVLYALEQCPFNSEHRGGSSCVTVAADGKLGFKCHHNGCHGKTWRHVRDHFEPDRNRDDNGHAEHRAFVDAEIDSGLYGEAWEPVEEPPVEEPSVSEPSVSEPAIGDRKPTYELCVQPQNDKPRRLVTFHKDGVEVHRDLIDVNVSFLRETFQKAVKAKVYPGGRRPPDVFGDGVDPTDSIHEDILWKAIEADKAQEGSGKIVYQQLSCAQLDAAEYSTEYIVESLIVAGQPLIFAGAKKTLKTNLLIALGIALATGTAFLGKFIVARSVRVAMMSGESGLATIQETARRIADAAGWNLADVQNLIFSPDLPIFGDPYHTEALRQFLKENEIELLIIDPAYLAIPCDGQEGSLFAVGKLLRGMAQTCQSVGVTMCLAHHTKKNVADPFSPVELEDISWAGFQEFSRQWVLVSRRQKYEPGSGEHLLWMNSGGSAGHSSLWGLNIQEGVYDGRTPRHWEVDVLHAEDVRQEAREADTQRRETKAKEKATDTLTVNKKRVLNAVANYKDGETSNVIEVRSGMSRTPFRVAFAELLNDGAVVECGTFKKDNGQSYPAYKLTPEPNVK